MRAESFAVPQNQKEKMPQSGADFGFAEGALFTEYALPRTIMRALPQNEKQIHLIETNLFFVLEKGEIKFILRKQYFGRTGQSRQSRPDRF